MIPPPLPLILLLRLLLPLLSQQPSIQSPLSQSFSQPPPNQSFSQPLQRPVLSPLTSFVIILALAILLRARVRRGSREWTSTGLQKSHSSQLTRR